MGIFYPPSPLKSHLFSGINLSCNKGHQNALLAGLMTVKEFADVTISMDADLQDDIDAIDEFLEKYFKEAVDIVYGVRNSRETDTFFKRFTAECFYRFVNFLGAHIIFNHADYRLMSKRALDSLEKFKEVNLFLRGIIPMIGYKTDVVYYSRNERFAGKSKYPLRKMLSFAFQGISSLSTQIMKIITCIGLIIFSISIIFTIYFSYTYFFNDKVVPGWASIIVSVWGLGGIQLLGIGIVGEYIGKIYLETKHRPRYIVESTINLS
ncbi:glycosyltransferase [Lachnospiraceae bacterium 47-T17]